LLFVVDDDYRNLLIHDPLSFYPFLCSGDFIPICALDFVIPRLMLFGFLVGLDGTGSASCSGTRKKAGYNYDLFELSLLSY